MVPGIFLPGTTLHQRKVESMSSLSIIIALFLAWCVVAAVFLVATSSLSARFTRTQQGDEDEG